MKESVYIETTVISYLTAWLSRDLIRAAHQQITQEWWHHRRNDFEIYVSEFVVIEASAGDSEAAKERLEVLKGIALLDVNEEVENLAKKLVEGKALPAKAVTDALHIAVAAVHGANVVITKFGGATDYFGPHAFYVNPYDVDNIRETLVRAWQSPPSTVLRRHIADNLTWDHSAQRLSELYRHFIERKRV